ncbi:unnamed protein product [Echinostoma caproni]|uniref:Neuroblast differentiation-associated AHNAK-like n=1 Tax=Echinostoma caproni TaxID=27848 RepID=A0A183AGY6_9TREM|nr:unnamed protein product [Echinostoma caproni]
MISDVDLSDGSRADVSVKAPKFGFKFGKKAKTPGVSGEASLPGVEISGPKLHAPDVNLGVDVGGVGDVGADVKLPKADVSVKAPKFGFKFGKKAKGPKVEGPSLGVSATGTGDADLGVSVKGEAPRGGLKLKLPKLKWPKGSLKLGGDADVSGKVKVPDASVSVSGPEIGGGVELPQVPGADASLSLPGLDAGGSVGVRPDLGGDVSLTGGVDLPSADVSVPSKKFHFGFGGKAKGDKKLKKPKVSGKADLGLDVGADLHAPDVDLHAGGEAKGHGFKFGWSPKISLPKVKLGHGDLSADADLQLPKASVDVSGPSIKLPSVSADVDVPRVDVQIPGVSTGGDLGGTIDLGAAIPSVSVGGDVKVPDLSVSGEMPSVAIGGDMGLSGTPGSVGVDLSMPQLDVDASLPSVEISGPKLHAPDVNLGVDVGGVGDVGADVKLPKVDVSLKGPEFGVELPKVDIDANLPGVEISGPKLHAPDVNLGVDVGGVGDVGADVKLPKADVSMKAPIFGFQLGTMGKPSDVLPASSLGLPFDPSVPHGSVIFSFGGEVSNAVPCDEIESTGLLGSPECSAVHAPFASLRRHKSPKRNADTDVDSGIGVAETAGTTRTVSTENLGSPIDGEFPADSQPSEVSPKGRFTGRSTLPRWFRPAKSKTSRPRAKAAVVGEVESPQFSPLDEDKNFYSTSQDIILASKKKKDHEKRNKRSSPEAPDKSEKNRKSRKTKQTFGKKKKPKSKHFDASPQASADGSVDGKPIPRVPSAKSKDLLSRKTWHGVDDAASKSEEPSEPPTLPPTPSGIHIQPVLYDNLGAVDLRRRGTSDSAKRRPWSTLELPPPGCVFVNDDYLFPDALTPTKIPSFRGSKDVVYNVPYMDDKALPPEEPDWPIGESRRTLLSQLSQKSDSIIRIAAEEESSIISLDDAHGRSHEGKGKSKRLLGSSKKESKRRTKEKDLEQKQKKESKSKRPRSKSSGRFSALFSKTPRHTES